MKYSAPSAHWFRMKVLNDVKSNMKSRSVIHFPFVGSDDVITQVTNPASNPMSISVFFKIYKLSTSAALQ